MSRRCTVGTWLFALFIISAQTVAVAEVQIPLVSPPTSIWWVPIVSAFIGAISGLVSPFVKDFLIQVWNEKRGLSNRQHEIFRNYVAPLTTSCEKLIWRFNEIFIENRHHFLKMATFPLVYNEYKRKSTLYRIASLLGWIRAINLELNALPRGASGFLTPISDAIHEIQSALADGPHVELHRLEQLCTVWRLSLGDMAEESKKKLAMKVEVKLYELAGDAVKHDSESLRNFAEDKKVNLCESLSTFLCEELRRVKLDKGIIRETVNQAIAAMSYREALIYRDWQDAIGDAMLKPDTDSVRKFNIIGYEKFEEVLKDDSLWMEVFRGSIDDIDFDSIDPNDFRAKQLKDVSVAVAKILISLSKTEECDLINNAALAVADKLEKQS